VKLEAKTTGDSYQGSIISSGVIRKANISDDTVGIVLLVLSTISIILGAVIIVRATKGLTRGVPNYIYYLVPLD
jgi:hypothetical protein